MQSMLNERPNSQKQKERERGRERGRDRQTDRQTDREKGGDQKAVSSTVMWFSISHLIGVTWQRGAGLQQGLPQ